MPKPSISCEFCNKTLRGEFGVIPEGKDIHTAGIDWIPSETYTVDLPMFIAEDRTGHEIAFCSLEHAAEYMEREIHKSFYKLDGTPLKHPRLRAAQKLSAQLRRINQELDSL